MFKMVNPFVLTIFLLIPCLSFASEVVLKSGQKIEGKIVEQTAKYVKIDPGIGIAVTYYAEDIDTVDGQQMAPPPAAQPSQFIPPVQPTAPIEQAQPAVAAIPVVPSTPSAVAQPNQAIDPTPIAQPIPASDSNTTMQQNIPSIPSMPRQPNGQIFSNNSNSLSAQNIANATTPDFHSAIKKTFQPIHHHHLIAHFSPQGFDNRNAARIPMVFPVGLLIIIFMFVIVSYGFLCFCLYTISKKTNKGVAVLAWIPFAQVVLMCQIADVPYVWLLLMLLGFIPLVGSLVVLGFSGYMWYKIALVRKKEGWWGILTCLPLINFVALGYLAFSD